MVDTNQQVVEEARQRGETLTTRELLLLIEQHHRPEGPGVKKELLEAYNDTLAQDANIPYQEGQLLETIERDLTDSETWVGEDSFYSLGDGRISAFPAGWHETLGDSTDLRAYVDVMEEGLADEDTPANSQRGGMGTGVPESLLLEAAEAIGGITQDTAKDRLEEFRSEGSLVEDADQHPDARVSLSEEAEEMRDDWLEG